MKVLRMKKFTKLLLVLTIVNFVLGLLVSIGVIHVGDTANLYLLLPVGAVFFGLFMIWHMLEKESAAYDAEQRGH